MIGFYSKTALKRREYRWFFCTILGFALFFLQALRSKYVGTDSIATVAIYENIGSRRVFVNSDFFPIYGYLIRILYALFQGEQAILILNAAIIITAVMLLIYEFSCDQFLSVYLYIVLYFYHTSFNIARQYSAIGFCLIAYVLFEKKNKLAWLFAVCALGTHVTSFIFFAVYFAYKFIPKLHNIGFQLCICLIGAVAVQFLFTPLFSLVARILPHYALYTTGSMNLMEYQGQGRKLILTLVYLVFLLLAYFAIKSAEKKGKEIPEELRQEYFFVCIGVMLGLAGSKLQLIARLESYLTIFAIVLIPKVVRAFRGRTRTIVYLGCMAVMFVPFFIQLSGNTSGVMPYMLCWE